MIANEAHGVRRLAINAPWACDPAHRPAPLHLGSKERMTTLFVLRRQQQIGQQVVSKHNLRYPGASLASLPADWHAALVSLTLKPSAPPISS